MSRRRKAAAALGATAALLALAVALAAPRVHRTDWRKVPLWEFRDGSFFYPPESPRKPLADTAGVPLVRLEPGGEIAYSPLAVAHEALRLSSRLHEPAARRAFGVQVAWLMRHARRDSVRGVLWEHPYDWPPNGLRGPWISAMTQGTAMAALTRAWRATGDSAYLRTAAGAVTSFERGERQGGVVKEIAPGVVVFQDFPGERYVVLDGWLAGLAGLQEYAAASGDPRARAAAARGIASFRVLAPGFHNRVGLFYSSRRDLTSPAYFEHAYNSARYLALTEPRLRPVVSRWEALRRGGFWAGCVRVYYQAANWRLMRLRPHLDPVYSPGARGGE